MDDTTIITNAHHDSLSPNRSGGTAPTGAITGSSIWNRANNITSGGLSGIRANTSIAAPEYADLLKALDAIYGAPKPTAIEPPPKPRKPPPALPVEVWQEGAFDADRAWQATIAACKGVR